VRRLRLRGARGRRIRGLTDTINICIYTHIYIHTYTYIGVYTYTYIYIYSTSVADCARSLFVREEREVVEFVGGRCDRAAHRRARVALLGRVGRETDELHPRATCGAKVLRSIYLYIYIYIYIFLLIFYFKKI